MPDDFADLAGPAAAVQRACDAGVGLLAVGRPWVQYEGWVLKESGALTGGYHTRFFVVSGDRLEYFSETKCKLEVSHAAAQTPSYHACHPFRR